MNVKTYHMAVCMCVLWGVGCGGGVAVKVTVDEVVFDVSIDDATTTIEKQLRSTGFLPPETLGLPETWPDSLPDITWSSSFTTKPQKVDIKEKIDSYSQYTKVIERIELNKVIVRLEKNSTTVPIPGLKFQMATNPQASPNQRFAWQTIGEIPQAPLGYTGDLELQFYPGGETLLYNQLDDDEKAFAVRALGTMVFDTHNAQTRKRPSGVAKARLITVITVFLAPDNYLK
jgi:hypothetical protein